MLTISLCMIVRNEEANIGKCLESVYDLVDEIVIVDTGSTDKTKVIASLYTSNIYDFEWEDNFSTARNFSFSKATKEYVFWLDADDVLLDTDRQRFRDLKYSMDPSIDVLLFKYNYSHDENGNVVIAHYRERLLKRSRNFRWKDPIHEYLDVNGKIAVANICVTHTKPFGINHRNIRIFEKMISEGKELNPRNMYYFARELYSHERYDEAIMYFTRFLDSGKGLLEDSLNTCYCLAICYKRKKEYDKMMGYIFKSFEYTVPRAEFCCELGHYFLSKKEYHTAIYWYEQALTVKKPKHLWGFDIVDCWDFIPCIQLAVCYDRLGDMEKAVKYNDLAAQCKPEDVQVLMNKQYFSYKSGSQTALSP
ncbi:MAG: glycosyltransferase [Clostridia bacterium]|nr:glycosyltransferase [Clostridia bacterium]